MTGRAGRHDPPDTPARPAAAGDVRGDDRTDAGPTTDGPPTDRPPTDHRRDRIRLVAMYFTDRGIEELEKRRGEEEITFEWLAEQLRTFVDLNPDFEVPVERLATWLARLEDDEDDEE
ncbi:hypothetical protein SSP531S_20320 [Streptomyces spongiicola]|uniref:Uncharacterized protein n=2 Tax=Streptomyces spongiicola TaxID=1690221 RepID=A0A388SX38_9ACTN|nr:hypothetical protein SSP531S_20320 [Streptomyces spongiicola]